MGITVTIIGCIIMLLSTVLMNQTSSHETIFKLGIVVGVIGLIISIIELIKY